MVGRDSRHDLQLGFRCRLLSILDEGDGPEFHGTGRQRRVRLAELSIQKVLPIWKVSFGSDRTADQALELANDLLHGKRSASETNSRAGALWTHCDNLMSRNQDAVNVVAIGHGAVAVVWEALSETPFGCEQVAQDATDLDVDSYAFNSSLLASFAYSDGAVWDDTSDAHRRLEFWQWWLTSAIGQAAQGG